MTKKKILSASFAIMMATSPAIAATSIPVTYYEVQIGGATTSPAGPGTFSSALGSVTTQASPMPALKTRAAVGDAREDANAYMQYFYRIDGPVNVVVPVSLAGSIHLTAQAGDTAQANAFGQADLPTPFTTDFAFIEIDRGGTVRGTVSDLTFNLHGSVYTGGWNSIILRSGTVTRGSRDDSAMGSSFVDPILSIDHSFFTGANAGNEGLYSLSFSNDVTNGLESAVPEAATWAMMLLGFGIVGFALRRRAGNVTAKVAYG